MAQSENRDPVNEFYDAVGSGYKRDVAELIVRLGTHLIGVDKTKELVGKSMEERRRREDFFAEGQKRGEPSFITLARWVVSEYDLYMAAQKSPEDPSGK